jgi:hypothetical protein
VRTTEALKYVPCVKRICRINGSAELLRSRRRPMSTSLLWNLSIVELPGVIEDGMLGRNGWRP